MIDESEELLTGYLEARKFGNEEDSVVTKITSKELNRGNEKASSIQTIDIRRSL